MRIRVPGLGRSRAQEARAVAMLEFTETQIPLERRADTITLIYELLDAHQDTAEIAHRLCDDPEWVAHLDPEWVAHLDYLRALQRVGREMLARMPPDEGRR